MSLMSSVLMIFPNIMAETILGVHKLFLDVHKSFWEYIFLGVPGSTYFQKISPMICLLFSFCGAELEIFVRIMDGVKRPNGLCFDRWMIFYCFYILPGDSYRSTL